MFYHTYEVWWVIYKHLQIWMCITILGYHNFEQPPYMYIYIYAYTVCIYIHNRAYKWNFDELPNPLCVEYIINKHRMQETRFFSAWPVAMFWYLGIHTGRISRLFKHISYLFMYINWGTQVWPILSIYHIFMIGIFKYHDIYTYEWMTYI